MLLLTYNEVEVSSNAKIYHLKFQNTGDGRCCSHWPEGKLGRIQNTGCQNRTGLINTCELGNMMSTIRGKTEIYSQSNSDSNVSAIDICRNSGPSIRGRGAPGLSSAAGQVSSLPFRLAEGHERKEGSEQMHGHVISGEKQHGCRREAAL